MDAFEILVVDDQPEITDMISMYLAAHGYLVDRAHDPYAALQMCAQKLYKLVITDIRMPGMSGLELLHAVKKRQPTAIVYVMTGCRDSETLVNCLEHGAADFVTKPISSLRLLVDLVTQAQERVARWKSALKDTSYAPLHAFLSP